MAQETESGRIIGSRSRREALQQLGARLKKARLKAGMSRSAVARLLSVDPNTMWHYETGRTEPTVETIYRLAQLYGVPAEPLLSAENDGRVEERYDYVGQAVLLPLKGYISAGIPQDNYEIDLGEVPAPPSVLARYPAAFALRVSGESLLGEGILDGDTILVDPELPLEDGRLHIVRLNDQLCAKRVFLMGNRAKLVSPNQDYQDMLVRELQVVGRVVYMLREL